VCEALTTVKIHSFVQNYGKADKTKCWLEVWRKKELTDEQQDCIQDKCVDYEGRVYGFLKIVPHALDGLLSKVAYRDVYLFRRLCWMDAYPHCSWLGAHVFHHCVGPNELGRPNSASPDDIHDSLIFNESYERVWSFGTL